ncbi:MAG: iron ABC transporter permease [Hyphomicrobiaceae bacterium]|nr:iron ABC transporter permease [Hyphomicrobiaceae bacterium]
MSDASLSFSYLRIYRRRLVVVSFLALALGLSFLVDVATGPSVFPFGEVLRGFFDPSSLDRAKSVILWEVRLPYAIMAVLVGAALGLAGAEMQTVLNNPLASPFTLGVSEAAAFGASLAIVFGLLLPAAIQTIAVPLLAFLTAFGACLVIQALSRAFGAGAHAVILFGIALVFVFKALIALVQFVADADALQQIVFWTMGSLGRTTWEQLAIVACVLAVCFPFSMRAVWMMTAMRTGEAQAMSLGIPVERLRLIVLFRVSVLAGVAVAFAGSIGFIGLVGPHIARLSLGEDHRLYLPGSALAGALILSVASIASKALIPGIIIPIGIVTALVGVPLFMALIVKQRHRL